MFCKPASFRNSSPKLNLFVIGKQIPNPNEIPHSFDYNVESIFVFVASIGAIEGVNFFVVLSTPR